MNAEVGEFEKVNMFLCVYDLCPVRESNSLDERVVRTDLNCKVFELRS